MIFYITHEEVPTSFTNEQSLISACAEQMHVQLSSNDKNST
jgi:hypothetical protein